MSHFSTDHNLLSISPASYNALLGKGGGKELIKYLRNSKLSLKKTAELIPRYYRLVNLFSTSVILPTAEKTSSQKGGNSKYGLLYKKFQF